MDVTLVLTHRCNLACGYCYAGEHVRRDLDEDTLERALDLLFADGAKRAQLSFFGGEPFLAFATMRRAVAGAQRRAAAAGAELTLQCTSNGTLLRRDEVAFVRATGMRVTVSIDGVREAHDLNRPRAGGGSSFDEVHRGLRGLLDAGLRPDAMMVITPASAPLTYRSVSWLWAEGVDTVRANLELRARWSDGDRAELREELVAVGWEMLARRLRGEPALFEPFERGLRRGAGASACAVARPQVVVATGGNVYPCAPMVGEDRDDGPEAALRLGHVDDGGAALAARTQAGCSAGGACACAAWLETGDPSTGGAHGRWYSRVCGELGEAIAAALAEARRRSYQGGAAIDARPAPSRRPLLVGLALATGGLAVGSTALWQYAARPDPAARAVPVAPLRLLAPEPTPPPPGALAPPPIAPPPEPVQLHLQIEGDLGPPPEPIHVKGDLAAPELEIRVRGEIAAE